MYLKIITNAKYYTQEKLQKQNYDDRFLLRTKTYFQFYAQS